MAMQYVRLSTQRHHVTKHVYLRKFDSLDHSTNYSLSPRFSGYIINGHALVKWYFKRGFHCLIFFKPVFWKRRGELVPLTPPPSPLVAPVTIVTVSQSIILKV